MPTDQHGPLPFAPNAIAGESNTPVTPGVSGTNSGGGVGVSGNSDNGDGIQARTASSAKSGIFARNDSTGPAPPGVPGGNGVFGLSTVPNASGVFGANNNGGVGVSGNSDNGDGIQARTASSAKSGIFARNDSTGPAPSGVPGGNGVFGLSTVPNASGVFGANNNGGVGVSGTSENGIGVLGRGQLAGRFEGDVEVTGDISLVNGDCAEDFDIAAAERIEPGTVMTIDHKGALRMSKQAYDKRVAGVISGAGDLKPGIILGKQETQENRMPIALIGQVYCKVDAQHAAIEVGDLLTTSPTPGHAMKAADPLKAFGAVIGKALGSLDAGQALIPILVALQ